MNKFVSFLFSFLMISSATYAANYDCTAINNVEGAIALTKTTSQDGDVVFAGRTNKAAVSVKIQEAGGLVVATIEQENKMSQAFGGFTQMQSNKQQMFAIGLSANGATAGPVPTVAINCTKN